MEFNLVINAASVHFPHLMRIQICNLSCFGGETKNTETMTKTKINTFTIATAITITLTTV